MENPTDENQVRFMIDAWKTTVETQMHFNTIEMQIRGLAVTVLTTALGAAVLMHNQTPQADWMVFAGLVSWLAFYLMDRWWYHRLLKGAVSNAEVIEQRLKDIPGFALSTKIGEASPVKLP